MPRAFLRKDADHDCCAAASHIGEKEIYEIISCGEISIEGLQQKFDVGINELMIKLTQMELNGLIVQKNGLYYIAGI